MEIKHTVKFLRQRRLMIVLPLLVLPFITVAFWALGGGKGEQQSISPDAAGLNLQLPSSSLTDDKNEDKLSFYLEADADSLKRAELMRNDPFYRDSMIRQLSMMKASQVGQNPAFNESSPAGIGYGSTAVDEQQIYQRINDIDMQISQPQSTRHQPNLPKSSYNEDGQFTRDVDRIQEMVAMMNDKTTADPEMQELDGTLDKILDIQHPQRVQERIKEKSRLMKELVFQVSSLPQTDNISLLDTGIIPLSSDDRFYGVDGNSNDQVDYNSVEAVVHDNQVLVNGAVIRLRLSADVYVSGTLIPKGSFVYGIVSLNGERLDASINSIRRGNNIYPVKLQVYDVDGLPGIFIPGAITRDVAKESADNASRSVAFGTLDPSIGAQAASAGIEAAKTLLSKKVKLVKVAVKAGYKVILKDNNKQQ